MSSMPIRAAGGRFVLAAVAALVWLAVLPLGLSLDHHPEAPTALGVATFILALLVMPFAVGVALAWWQQTAGHLVAESSLARALAEWAFLLAAGLVTTVTEFERQIAYLSVSMNRLEALLVFATFGLAGGPHGRGRRGGCGVNLRRRASAARRPIPLGL